MIKMGVALSSRWINGFWVTILLLSIAVAFLPILAIVAALHDPM